MSFLHCCACLLTSSWSMSRKACPQRCQPPTKRNPLRLCLRAMAHHQSLGPLSRGPRSRRQQRCCSTSSRVLAVMCLRPPHLPPWRCRRSNHCHQSVFPRRLLRRQGARQRRQCPRSPLPGQGPGSGRHRHFNHPSAAAVAHPPRPHRHGRRHVPRLWPRCAGRPSARSSRCRRWQQHRSRRGTPPSMASSGLSRRPAAAPLPSRHRHPLQRRPPGALRLHPEGRCRWWRRRPRRPPLQPQWVQVRRGTCHGTQCEPVQ
mmetsp:Transcript_66172/g.166877  ORF Transcript_66172/g.166877 Transcript_66172/m.166877 type:complete len:259 (-) Transcript_66172:823-1599(-)